MPRIDDALARARTYRREDSAPVTLPPDEPGARFPVEGEDGSLLDPAPRPAPSGPPAVPAAADRRPEASVAPVVLDPPAPPADSVFRQTTADRGSMIDAAPDSAVAPVAEKLMSATRKLSSVEQYRRLAARLYVAQGEQRVKVVMMTSALPGEGKTLTAANLALTFSESYRRQVLLIDADLRRPSIHELFQVPNVTGLNEGLRAEADRKVPVIRLTDHLTILTAGRPEPDPMSVLSSDRMRRMLEEAAGSFDWVIVDTPPIGLLSDARLLASLVDTVLLVVRAGSTPVAAINSAVEAIGRDRILGVVLNRADQAQHAEYAYQYYTAPRTQE